MTNARQKARRFEKRSQNFFSTVAQVAPTRALNKQKFFGSFFQKRTACCRPPGEARISVNHKGG
jgi:hypothetical protein